MTNTAQPRASHFIGGDYVEDTAGGELISLHPATGLPVANLHAATDNIINRAIIAAKLGQADVFDNIVGSHFLVSVQLVFYRRTYHLLRKGTTSTTLFEK